MAVYMVNKSITIASTQTSFAPTEALNTNSITLKNNSTAKSFYPAHVGELPNVFIFLEHRLNGTIKAYYTCLDKHLLNGVEEIELPTKLTIYISLNFSISGEFWVYVGYRMSEGPIVSNCLKPFKF